MGFNEPGLATPVRPWLAWRVGGLAGALWAGGKSRGTVRRKQKQTFLWLPSPRKGTVARMEADES